MKFILGKKIAMTQIWQQDTVVPVTRILAGPCVVIRHKTDEKDGYNAVQVGFGVKATKNIRKPQLGEYKELGNFRYVKEFRLSGQDSALNLQSGDYVTVSSFKVGDRLTIVGTSKGKGFQGVVRRHGFHGQDATHGNKDQLRMPGSIGSTGPQHVFKGTRMAGRMGGDSVTLHDVEVIAIDEKDGSLYVKGAVPGARNGLIMLSSEGEVTPLSKEEAMKVISEEVKEEKEETADENKEEVKEETEQPEEVKEEVVEEAKEEAEVKEEVAMETTEENKETSEEATEEKTEEALVAEVVEEVENKEEKS
ncbi:MAG: 50S ribosomal protein L3 [Patescibacteria group bacterium]|nr:MAG: 50S ribosomal protein L3 [Patescibacteria group bacterium]